jgi:hypothetical protein
MTKEPKYKMVQSSVPMPIYRALEAMAAEAGKSCDELIESLLTQIIYDDDAAHGRTGEEQAA